MTMKRRNQTICAVLLSTLLIGIPVQAEIPEDSLSDYMGDWYVNYMVEEDTQLNMAGLLGYTMLLTLNDDGTAHMEMMMLEESAEEEENEAMEGSWTYADGRIVLKMDDESVMELDAEEGDLVGKAAEEEYSYLFGRELVKEDVDLDALMAGSEDEENQKLADTEKANPFSYNAETNNLVDVLSAYMYANYYSEDFVVTVDEANKTFTADREESDYLAAAHYDGTYEITEDGFVNATWKEPDYDYDMSCVGSEYAAQWDKFTLKEDLSNLDDVLYSVMNEYSWDHDYPRESLTRTETSELEGTAVLKDGDAERSAVYKIYAGVDPLVKVTIHENDSDVNYTNYYFRE